MHKFNQKSVYKTAVILLLCFFVFSASPAFADPSSSELKAKKEQAQAQLEELNAQLDECVEDYNEAMWKLSETEKKVARIKAEIEATEQEIKAIEEKLSLRARTLYMSGGTTFLSVLFEARSVSDVFSDIKLFVEVFAAEADLDASYKEKKAKLEQDNQKLMALFEEQKALAAQAEAKKKEIEARVKEKQDYIASLDKQIKEALQREQEARQVAYVPSAYQNQTPSRTPAYSSRGTSRGDLSIGQAAVSIAMKQLGKPYRWGAAGPGAFDCSGLTMYVYAQLGIYLPHSSRAQYNCGVRVSRSELQPGDLVFFARRSGRIGHVGIYIGNGMMIHAPQTGDVVRIVPLNSHSGYAGAVRPY